MVPTARELYGNHLLSEFELNPIVDVLDQCRDAHLRAIDEQVDVAPDVRTTAYRAAALAHQSLFHAIAMVAIDAGKPTTDTLGEMRETTRNLREQLLRLGEYLYVFVVV